MITPGYFEALRVAVVRGRDVGDGDRLDAPFVAVVNEQLVKDAFPGVDPIGRTIRAGLDSLTPMTIVGIVKDIRTRGPARPVQAEIYFPYEQHPGPATALNLVVRADERRTAGRRRGGGQAGAVAPCRDAGAARVDDDDAGRLRPPRRGSGRRCWWPLPGWRCCWRWPASTA